jgi:hypothetical protein
MEIPAKPRRGGRDRISQLGEVGKAMEDRMASNALVGNKQVDTFVRWGVAAGPALWPTVLRILFVIDGRINTSFDPQSFGLGYVLETLRDDSFAWWVRFKVQVVRRDYAEVINTSPALDTNYTDGNEPIFAVFGFKFTEPNFNFYDWDQVWFFGDNPGNRPPHEIDPGYVQYYPLDDEELKRLAEWMDRGGGVFAAGDHWNLGASMCSRIPRARTMRKWTPEQGVPTMDGFTRNQTLQPGPGYEDFREGDTIPQPIELVYRLWTTSILTRPPFPHPLLSTTTGVIDTFPDHMHEGEVINDDEVELDSPLNIPGYERPEYPFAQPLINPDTDASARIAPGADPLKPRPCPHVVAYGRTTNLIPILLPPVPGSFELESKFTTKRFGLVGAYDGDSVGIGRVVVDSTWHHWFSFNLHGFYAASQQLVAYRLPAGLNYTTPTALYELMQTYYRNVGLWLATPAQRRSMLIAATWGPVVSDPMAFPAAPTRSLWAVGKRALEVIARTVSQSMLFDFVASFFSGRADDIFGVPYDVNPADPYAASVPVDLAVRAIVGGIASSLIRPAFEYVQAEGKPRRLLDPDAIARHAAKGVKEGHHALIDTIQSSATASKGIVGRLEDAFQPSPHRPIPVDLITLRVMAERLQLPDPTDPALADGRRVRGQGGPTRFTITARVAIADSVIAYTVFDEIEVPSFQSGGAFVNLDRVLYEGVVQSGESLVVEVVTGAAERERVAAERLRFTETLGGDPSNWVGPHAPSRSQPWRLWYRIEKTDDTH